MNKTCIVMQTPVTIPITGASGRDSWGGLIPNIKQRMNWPGPRTWDEKASHKMSGCGIGAERWEENASKRGKSVTLCMCSAQLGSGSSSRSAQAINVCCGDVACADESGERGPPSKRGGGAQFGLEGSSPREACVQLQAAVLLILLQHTHRDHHGTATPVISCG